ECTVVPLSSRASKCLPRAITAVTVAPRRSDVANAGTRKSLRVSERPASARSSRCAVSQTVSPSGTRSGSQSQPARCRTEPCRFQRGTEYGCHHRAAVGTFHLQLAERAVPYREGQ